MDIGMSLKNKVIWSEGMFLQQQHFQQQDRFFERLVDSRITSAGHYLWGVQDLVLDVEALTLGKVSLSSVSGIFPDGTPISVPELEEIGRASCRERVLITAVDDSLRDKADVHILWM